MVQILGSFDDDQNPWWYGGVLWMSATLQRNICEVWHSIMKKSESLA
jgi:hypothetical protein